MGSTKGAPPLVSDGASTEATKKPARRPRKRADGEGTLYQRPDGLWVGELMVGYKADGKPDRRRVSAKTQAEARKKLATLRQQAAGGLLPDRDKRDTLAGYIDRWLDGTKATVRASTHARYAQLLRLHVVPSLGQKRLDALRPDDLQRLYADLLTKVVEHGQGRKPGKGAALSPRTVHHVHVVLHTALEQAVKWSYLPRNVADVVEPPRVPKATTYTPDAGELRRFLDAAADDPLRPAWTLAVYTGMRLGELLGLTWADVDLDAGAVTVARTLLLSTRGGVPAWGEPKTERSHRTIAIPAEAVEALRAHRQRQLEARLLLGPDYAPYDLTFATATGHPLSHRNTERAFKAALARADLPASVRVHDLRHGAATAMRAGGIDLKTVSERLGHANIAITADLYTHGVTAADRDAASKLADLLRPRDATGGP